MPTIEEAAPAVSAVPVSEPAVVPMVESLVAEPAMPEDDDGMSLDFDLGDTATEAVTPPEEDVPAPAVEPYVDTVVTGENVADALDFDLSGLVADDAAAAETPARAGEAADTEDLVVDFDSIDLPESADFDIAAPMEEAAAPDFSPEGTLVVSSTGLGQMSASDFSFDAVRASEPATAPSVADKLEPVSDALADAGLGEIDHPGLTSTVVNPNGVAGDMDFDVKLSDSVFLGQPMMNSDFDMDAINLDLSVPPPAPAPDAAAEPERGRPLGRGQHQARSGESLRGNGRPRRRSRTASGSRRRRFDRSGGSGAGNPRPHWRVKSLSPALGRRPPLGPSVFDGAVLHPTAALILWSSAVIAVQYLAYPPLAAFAVVLGVLPGVLRVWLGFVYRARWLLLTLWLILAYNTPGEAYADLLWAPTYEGVAEASLHAARLIVVLGCLSWLLVRLGRDGMLAGLWGALAPARACGLDSERLLVRLALVLERLQAPPGKRRLGAACCTRRRISPWAAPSSAWNTRPGGCAMPGPCCWPACSCWAWR